MRFEIRAHGLQVARVAIRGTRHSIPTSLLEQLAAVMVEAQSVPGLRRYRQVLGSAVLSQALVFCPASYHCPDSNLLRFGSERDYSDY